MFRPTSAPRTLEPARMPSTNSRIVPVGSPFDSPPSINNGSVVWALVRLTSGGETLRAYVYKATVQALPGRAVLVMCAAGAGMLGTALCMIVHGTAGRLAGLLLCLLLKAALLAGAWLLRRYVQTLPWEGPPEETAD